MSIYDEHGNLTAAEAIRRAQKYFEDHPTLLKPFQHESPSRDTSKNIDHYPIKNPYYEDTQVYDLDHCIKNGMLPVFGYPLIRFGERPSFDFNMLMPNIVGYLREKQQAHHLKMCFTWGYPIRRLDPHVVHKNSKLDELKRRFNRVALIRRFYSVKRRGMKRKFKYPVDWFGNLVKAKTSYDFQQYCCESEHEHEYPRRTRRMRKELAGEICQLKYGVTPAQLAELRRKAF